jgi:hypothetical protein
MKDVTKFRGEGVAMRFDESKQDRADSSIHFP